MIVIIVGTPVGFESATPNKNGYGLLGSYSSSKFSTDNESR